MPEKNHRNGNTGEGFDLVFANAISGLNDYEAARR
jgi:hypothetical protein